MAIWTCTCGKRNTAKTDQCGKCGTERPFEPGATDAITRELPTCAWETDGKRCFMLATVYEGLQPHRDARGEAIRPGYCGWHAICRTAPALTQDFDEFERWQLDLLERGYCTQFTHHRGQYVWAAVRGQWRPDAERERAKACAAATCFVHDLDPVYGKTAPPAQARGFIRAILDRLLRTVTP